MGAGARRRKPEELRSHRWFGVDDLRSFGHRSRSYQIGFAREDFAGKPVIGIINTWSDINPCHTHFRQRAEEVKRGVWQAGGFPLELPAISLSEPSSRASISTFERIGMVLRRSTTDWTWARLLRRVARSIVAFIFAPSRVFEPRYSEAKAGRKGEMGV